MRRAALPLLLLAGAHAHAVGPVDDAVARVTQVAAWFRGGPAPRHWTVTKATDIRGAYGDWREVGAGAHGRAFEVPGNASLVVRTRAHRELGGARHTREREARSRAEALYLEFARGRAGAPALRGGWLEGSKLFYVVRRAGTALTESDGDVPYPRPAPAWSARCRAAPLAAARALVECIRSFTDAGYFLEDLDGGRFALDEATGEVFTVAAPEPLATSPILGVLDWALHGVRTNRSANHRTRWDRGKACRSDGECPATTAQHRCANHDCAEVEWEAREARGWCRNGRCVGVDARAHVYDLATRAWALPLILAEGRFPSPEAKRRLEELIKRMRSEAPEDRPSFLEVLRALDDKVEPAPAWPAVVSGEAAAVARAAAAAAWLKGAPAPRHWTVRAKDNCTLDAPLGSGAYKRAFTIRENAGVLVKTRAHIAHGARKRRVHGEETARDEVVYLEFLRGAPGVPRLLGGWIDVYEPNNATEYYPDRVYYAVERVGASLAHDRLLPGKHSAQGNTRDLSLIHI